MADQTKLRYDWYQSDSSVVISIYARKVQKENFSVVYLPQLVNIDITLFEKQKYNLLLTLAKPIQPDMCRHVITPVKVEITLFKVESCYWSKLESDGTEEFVKMIPPVTSPAVNPQDYPSSHPSQHQWESLRNDMDDMPELECDYFLALEKAFGKGTDAD